MLRSEYDGIEKFGIKTNNGGDELCGILIKCLCEVYFIVCSVIPQG